MRARSAVLLLGSLFLLVGCAPQNPIEQVTQGDGDSVPPPEGIGNAIVIEDAEFRSNRGSLISILRDNIRGMSVSRENACPHIVLRGGIGRSQAAEVLVYVDGQRFSDTCILDSINIESIAWAEVYPSGVTQRAGYSTNAGGLILFFMKNSREARERGV